MRPLTLELEGFLSHSELTTIDFDGLGAAVIVGENGSGKTSVVEGLGWALFGTGRGRGPDDYVSHTGTTCRVAVVFELGGQRYRVERHRSISGSGKSSLALASEINGNWVPVGGDRISETQDAICTLLGMDAETWEATAFIGQGKADTFTQMKPAARKELLAEILQLGRYQVLHERAKDQERTLGAEHTSQLARSEELEDYLKGEPEAVAEAERAVDQKAGLEKQLAELEERLAEARKTYELAREKAARLEDTRTRLTDLQGRRDADRRRYIGEAEGHETRAAKLAEDIALIEQTVERLRNSGALGTKLQQEAFLARADVDRLRAEVDLLNDQAAQAAAYARALLASATASNDSLVEIAQRRSSLQASDDETCFACRQELTPEHRRNVMAKLAEDEEAIKRRMSEQTSKSKTLTTEAEGKRERAGKRARELTELEQKLRETERAAERSAADGERVPAEEARLEEMRVGLTEAQGAGARAHSEAESLGRPTPEEEHLAAELEQAGALEAKVADAATVQAVVAKDVDGIRGYLSAGIEALGKAQEALRHFSEAKGAQERAAARASEIGRGRFIYSTLALAFGRDGIPALIIENAVPQIEAEANELLRRFTDGRFSLQIASLRAKKTGGLKETLDIIVADETGERDLEQLSGGERQRVDLALRIALSRVLAHRADRSIGALIFDEAFTALDEGGLQTAVQIIRTLREEFPLIIAITHARDFAEAFDTRIEVTGGRGEPSRVEVRSALEAVAS